jgi:glycosyltransferase involved in cell wall biosynthesis
MGKTLTRNAKEQLTTVNRKLPASNSDLPSPIFDLIVYAKSGFTPGLLAQLANRYPRSKVLLYRHFRREELLQTARRARVCVYLSDDDRGPLALAEILTCGCPAVGMPRGAPWIEHGVNGALVDALEIDCLTAAIALARSVDRATVALAARERFRPRTVVRQIVEALETHVRFSHG